MEGRFDRFNLEIYKQELTMVTKKKSAKTSRVKVGKLKLNKETVKDLKKGESGKVKGGFGIQCSKFDRQSCVKLGPEL